MESKPERLQLKDFEEALDFLNYVFSYSHCPHDFEKLLPALYQRSEESAGCNWILRDKAGRIQALVGIYPSTLYVGGKSCGIPPLRVARIGGVSVHPRAQGKGYMKLLLDHCIGVVKKEGYDISWLAGQRQRYQYFGYELAGTEYHMTLDKDNVRHAFGKSDIPVTFRALRREDTREIEEAARLHASGSLFVVERSSFFDTLLSWSNEPYAAHAADGALLGYLVCTKDKRSLVELCATSLEEELRIAAAWVQQRGETVLVLPPCHGLVPRLAGISAEAKVSTKGMWLPICWEAVTEAALRLQASRRELPEGEVVVAVEGYGSLLLRVNGKEASCTRTERPPCLTAEPALCMRLLFGPLAPAAVLEVPAAAYVLHCWCPLPLYLGTQDQG
eukprot:TRINITY_DN18861_c0_g1_i2.p1 TRINITY_DN18861_c0_g1~~TRINITY_DN18861_c0_g1_i2.p1  ORF type:complete len:389 (-),score=79.05 TRINITY_DN18861_c0_g1_i2:61-1227(-)